MKTAEELFEKYAIKYVTHDNPNDFIETTSFLATEKFFFMKALAEHDKEIISLIDEMINIYNVRLPMNNVSIANARVVNALTELKQKIEAMK